MNFVRLRLLLPLLSVFTFAGIISAVPHKLNINPTIASPSQASSPAINAPLHLSRQRRGFSGTQISGLPGGWSGIFSSFSTTRPSIPIASFFIRFFKVAAAEAAKDPVAARWMQRFSYGVLVLEMMPADRHGSVSREFVQAVSLWLMNAAMNGWTGLFEAWVMDKGDGEMVYLRLATIWDLPEKISNSPWQ